MKTTKIEFGGSEVEIDTADPGETIDILPLLADSHDFHGDTHVNHVVHFGDLFAPLRGEFKDMEGVWDPSKLRTRGIVILEHYYDEAKRLLDSLNDLAAKLVKDSRLYDDLSFCGDYRDLTIQGYDLLRQHEEEFDMAMQATIPISLERAGLVTTRIAYGLDKDADVPGEIRIVTKRTHLKDDPDSNLTVTVQWRADDDSSKITGQEISLTDFVNPASGASVAALILAAQLKSGPPKTVAHRSISATCQGIIFMQKALKDLGITSSFYSLGEASQLNEQYYLAGDRGVGDAGHVLRHFLPGWYHQ